MNKTKIEWCDSTWNPVTGCRHECQYCYARKIAERFGGRWDEELLRTLGPDGGNHHLDSALIRHTTGKNRDKGVHSVVAPFPYGFDPTFHRYRLDEPQKRKDQQTIFVCSMADLFGDWVPDEWIEEVFASCKKAPQHRYLFLTKNPGRYMELEKTGRLPEEENFWYGSTITGPDDLFCWSNRHNTFVSIEPLLKPIPSAGEHAVKTVDWIIIGAMTGPGSAKHQPEREWVSSLVRDADAAGVPVFMKDSLIPIVNEAIWRRSLPWEVRE